MIKHFNSTADLSTDLQKKKKIGSNFILPACVSRYFTTGVKCLSKIFLKPKFDFEQAQTVSVMHTAPHPINSQGFSLQMPNSPV